jgi:hypothetical protein
VFLRLMPWVSRRGRACGGAGGDQSRARADRAAAVGTGVLRYQGVGRVRVMERCLVELIMIS